MPPAVLSLPPQAGATLQMPPPRRWLPTAVRYPRWNVSRHASRLRAADAFVVSIPSSGRTWLRVFLDAYFDEYEKRGAGVPHVRYTHDLWEHHTKARWSERWRGKWLIPPAPSRTKPILLVVRDPRDQMVSLYFHLSRRVRRYDGSISAMLRDPVFGVTRVITMMNRWLDEWAASRPSRLHVLRYEAAHRDPAAAFGQAVRFLMPDSPLDERAMLRALAVSSFENMLRIEMGDGDAEGIRHLPGTGPARGDPEARKVRRGQVGAYTDYLSRDDVAFLDRALTKLDPRYGYPSTHCRW